MNSETSGHMHTPDAPSNGFGDADGHGGKGPDGQAGHSNGHGKLRSLLELGGLASAVVLIAFGLGAIGLSVQGRNTVHTELARQHIVGAADMNPKATALEAKQAGVPASVGLPTCNVAGKRIENGSSARCFASYMRIHALNATGNETYSQMPEYATANGEGTNDPMSALTNSRGEPVENPSRTLWVTETALSTGLNASYMAEQLGMFGIVVGIALLLSGVGFAVITLSGALRSPETSETALAKFLVQLGVRQRRGYQARASRVARERVA
jgi:hypothetical protein